MAQVADPGGDGGGDCPGGEVTVTADAADTEVLVGHDIELFASASPLCRGAWNSWCPDFGTPPGLLLADHPEPLTKTACADKIGPEVWAYNAASGGGPALNREAHAEVEVTVVGPSETAIYGYGEPSYSTVDGAAVVEIKICPEHNGKRVGRCTRPNIAREIYVKQNGSWVPNGDGFQAATSIQWDHLRRCIVHRLSATCDEINQVDPGDTIGEARYRYRITYGTQCGETDGTLTTPVKSFMAERTGNCTYTVRPGAT